ncbi:MAG: polymer-forming cytoskeletal protein [Deltaproteobacteria bacterium]|nr:polymer-forming cytoskeletal protein [Deltaproteobacteria bacterium]
MNHENGTVIGATTQVAGSLRGDEDITILGRVDGNISSGQGLVVEASGVVVAETIEVASAIIHGTVVGNITATDLVHINEGGRVVGDLVAPRIVLAEGALFRGNIDMGPVDEGLEDLLGKQTTTSTRPALSHGRAKTNDATDVQGSSEKQAPSKPARPAPRPARPAPRPARPPRRVEKAPAPTAHKRATPTQSKTSLESRANAAAQAVARAVKKDPPKKAAKRTKSVKTSSKVPKPPTTAGRKTRVKRK